MAQQPVNLSDLMAMIIAATSVVITVLAVFVAFLLSRNYLQSIKEMEEIKSNSKLLNERVLNISDVNSTLLRESMLAVRSIFDLLMLVDRKSAHIETLTSLLRSQQWKGRSISTSEVETYRRRIENELTELQTSILARQTELYWLVGQRNEQAAHLHALATTRGDARTIQLLDDIRATRSDLEQRDELLVAITSLRQRLGRPSRSRAHQYDARAWTG